jgi:hypothetical protein
MIREAHTIAREERGDVMKHAPCVGSPCRLPRRNVLPNAAACVTAHDSSIARPTRRHGRRRTAGHPDGPGTAGSTGRSLPRDQSTECDAGDGRRTARRPIDAALLSRAVESTCGRTSMPSTRGRLQWLARARRLATQPSQPLAYRGTRRISAVLHQGPQHRCLPSKGIGHLCARFERYALVIPPWRALIGPV